jgi:phospholipid/cholesterol/gamma-HCH transport system substrate-binding protein
MDMTKHKTFRERNLTAIAIVSIAGVLLAIAGSFQLANLPFIAGSSYTARFTESGGLKTGDPVQVAGVTVGKVKSVDLEGNTVKVGFTAKDVDLGTSTTAQIKTGTLLGARFLQLTPLGSRRMDSGSEIPLSRTTAPYNLSHSLSDIAGHTQKIDLEMVAKAMGTFSDTFRQTSDELTASFDGVTALSRVISSRDAALRKLFARAEAVTGTFRERTAQITALIRDGNLILAELVARRQIIERLIIASSALADEVSGLVEDNQAQLRPALSELNKTLTVLNKNRKNISVAIERASVFIGGLGEGVAHGPWFAGHLDLATGPLGQPNLANALPGGADTKGSN